MSFVLDTSVTLAWLFDDETTEYAEGLLDALSAQEAWVPPLWVYGVGNVLVVAKRRSRITEAQARHFSDLLVTLPIRVSRLDPASLWDGALALARAQERSRYEASYLDLPLRMGLPLATLDAALTRAAHRLGVRSA